MNIVTLLKRKPTDREKQISDVANKILATFIDALQSADFRYVRFHTYPTNDPNGSRVIYVENEGYTLVEGDGDRGLGWRIDGVDISENINNCFHKWSMEHNYDCDINEVGFISNFEEFLDYTMRRVFSVQYTSVDILGHPAVKELLSKEVPHDFKCQS